MTAEAVAAPERKDTRVLLLPPTRRDGEVIDKVLSGAGLQCQVCRDMDELCAELPNGVGSVMVSEEALTNAPDGLIACVRSQPVWSDISTIVLSRSGVEPPKLTRVLTHLGNVAVLERPVRITTLITLVRSALRARERQYDVRTHLEQQRESASALRGSEERLRLAVQTGRLGVWELNVFAGEFSCSDGCRANYGRQPHEAFTYNDMWASIHADDAGRVRTALHRTVDHGDDLDVEYRTVWRDESVRWILMRGRPTLTSQGVASRLIGVTLDITERKTSEVQRALLLEAERAARSDAERAGRMKDEFLATLSHELRTPLNAILGWSTILSLQPPTEKDLAEGLRTIERNARAQTQIIEDLLDMSRIISGKVLLDVQRTNLAAIVQAAVDTVKPAADAKGVLLHVSLDRNTPAISGDPNRLQQVFWNLISNAVKFTPRGEHVRVELGSADNALQVRVIDTGEGISPEFLPEMFDRFRQADASSTRQHGGLGIGLAIVKQLVELHGGNVSAQSAGKGHGATFVVSLPQGAVLMEPFTSERRLPRGDALQLTSSPVDDFSSLKILVVDDEPDSRALVKRLLENCHAQVTAAGSAGEAFTQLQAIRPDILISDIGMPGEDGYSLIRHVRALRSDQGGNTPAIAVTAYARAEDRVTAVRAGFQHHISKPIEPAELIAIVANISRKTAIK